MTDEEIERIAEAVARRLERSMFRTPSGYWSLTDVSEYLQRSESWIRRKVYAGQFPPPELGGGKGAKMAWRPETIQSARIL